MSEKNLKRKYYHPLSISGFFFAPVFLIGLFLEIWILRTEQSLGIQEMLRQPYIYLLLSMSLVFLCSAFYKSIALLQPLTLLLAFLVPTFVQYDSMVGISLFISGIILLYRGGFLKTKKLLKIIMLLLYFYTAEISAAFLAHEKIPRTISTIFYISTFILFLFLIFKEQFAAFAAKRKPVFSLSSYGLSTAEAVYVKMLAEGKTHKEIACSCGISESTVRNTLSRVYKKLKVPDKYALMAILSSHEVKD